MAEQVKIMNLDLNKIKFVPSKPKSRFRTLLVDMNPLVVTFPKLRIPFDSKFNTYGQSEVSMSLGETFNSKVTSKDLIAKISSIDNFIIDLVARENWLDGWPSTIKYNPILKKSNNSNYPPTLKAKFSKKNEELVSVFLDEQNTVLESSESELLGMLKKGTRLLPQIEIAGIFFNDKTYGVTCKFYRSKIYPEYKEAEPEQEKQEVIDFSDDSESDVECVFDETD